MSLETRHHNLANVLRRSAYHRWLDVYLLRSSGDSVELIVPYREEFDDGSRQIQHAVIAALADLAAAAVGHLIEHPLAEDRRLQIDYRAEARIGNELYARAWLANQQVYVDIRTNDDRAPVARARLFVLPTARAEAPTVNGGWQPTYPV